MFVPQFAANDVNYDHIAWQSHVC